MSESAEAKLMIRCSNCDQRYNWFDGHECPSPPTAVAASDDCPMCGQEYDSWLGHLQDDH